jgi:hypothetical protein
MYKIGIQSQGSIVPSIFSEWLEDNSINLTSLLTHSYVLSAVSSPLIVSFTLAQLQYQKEEEDTDEYALETLNHGQFQNIRSITESPYEGWVSLLKGM